MSSKEKYAHKLKVRNKIIETSDTCSLVFEIPATLNEKFRYRAGQFITCYLDVESTPNETLEIRRSYSLASAPEVDSEFKICVKKVPHGKGSTYLFENVKVGDELWVTPPAGHFCLPKESVQQIVFFAAGSGITPIISLVKSALAQWPETSVALLYQNRNLDNIIFKETLEHLVQTNKSQMAGANPRLHVEHILSNATPSWTGLHGRINSQVIRQFLKQMNTGEKTIYYMCGPEGFMHEVTRGLQDCLIEAKRIFKESFHTAPKEQPLDEATPASADNSILPEGAICIGDTNALSRPSDIEASIEGETHTVSYTEGKSILDSLLESNLNPPYSCLDGACMACIAKVEEGLVYQVDMGILSDDNIEAKECLTCQARPASRKVKVRYETF